MKLQRDNGQWLIAGSVLGAALGTLAVWTYLRWGRESLTKWKDARDERPAGRNVKSRDILDLGMLILRLVRQIAQLMRPV